MATRPVIRVLFRATAGPRRGFGHLVRCGVLADALGADRTMSLRGSAPARSAARRRGWRLLTGRTAMRVIAACRPDLLVIDDPSPRHAAPWVHAARHQGVKVATVHDLGLGRVGADFTIDGSLHRVPGVAPADLQGPAFAILDPAVGLWRVRPGVRKSNRVLLALGGGAHILTIGPRLAARILQVVPGAEIDLAAGLVLASSPVPLPAGCRWLSTPDGLAPALATAAAAVVAGGISLYEACAIGTPTVALAVVPAQRATTRAFARAGAVIDASGFPHPIAIERAARGVARLLAHPAAASQLSRTARRLVDGGGTARVVRHLQALVHQTEGRASARPNAEGRALARPIEERRHVA